MFNANKCTDVYGLESRDDIKEENYKLRFFLNITKEEKERKGERARERSGISRGN